MKKFFKFVQAEPWALLSAPLAGVCGYITIYNLGSNWPFFVGFVAGLIHSYFTIKKWFKPGE